MKRLALLLALILPTTCWANPSRLWDGGTDNVNVGTAATVDNIWAAGGTVAFWIKVTAVDATIRRFANKAADDMTGGWVLALSSVDCTTGDDKFEFDVDYATTDASWCVGTGPTTGAWVHVAITLDASSATNDPKIYYNCVQQTIGADKNGTGAVTDDGANSLLIGNRASSQNRSADAAIAYFTAWKRVLSIGEVCEVMVNPMAFPASRVVLTPLWGDATETDLSGNGNTGAVTGTTATTDGPPVMLSASNE